MSLDRVLFVISNEPWQKVGSRPISAVADRVAMVEAAIAGRPEFAVSLVEIERGGPSYTVDTLRELGKRDPDGELVLIVGADAAAGIPTWERAEELPSMATLAIVARPGTPSITVEGFVIQHVTIPPLDISSTDLRARIAAGQPIDWLVPEGTRAVIAARGLYRDEA